MEPVGLAVGVLGLAGLFSACLEAVERFDSWNNFAGESRWLGARWNAERVRLEKWSRGVGFEKGVISPHHHEALDDPQILAAVCTHLSIIKELCSNADSAFAALAGTSAGPGKSARFLGRRPQAHLEALSESRRRKAKWSLGDKAKCTAQVIKLEGLVQQLYNLVPSDGPNFANAEQRGLGNDAIGRLDATVSGGDPWSDKIEQILTQLERDLEAETRKDLHAWLLGEDHSTDLYNDAVQRRLRDTCDWILTRRTFLDWADPDPPLQHARILWVNGAAGFGKTILCARIIEHLGATLELPPAHFFFSSDFEHCTDPFVAVRSWLSQLLSHPAVFEVIRKEWENHHSQRATRTDVVMIFRKVVHSVPLLTFVMDGVDECAGQAWDTDDATSVANFLKTIQQSLAGTTSRIMITSRDVAVIRQSITRTAFVTWYEYKISPDDVLCDNELYSRSIVDRKLHNKPEVVRNEISRRLTGRCNGQFLWIKMQEPSLRSGKNKKQLEAAIDMSPAGLENLYDRDWQRLLSLPKQESTRATSILRWAAFAVRPLTVAEVTECDGARHEQGRVRLG